MRLVRESGRKKVIMAGLWSEICFAMTAIHAVGEDVTFVTDASGGVSHEPHDLAVQRMIAAGANPMTRLAVLGEMAPRLDPHKQRSRFRRGFGRACRRFRRRVWVWEQQLLRSAKSAAA
jgi:isochorismate hydrolase